MHRASTRTVATLAAASLFLLAACGDDTEAGDGGLAGVVIGGEPGSAPEVEWDGRMEVTETESEVLVEGDGPEIAEGASAIVNVWIGNGHTSEKALSSYDEGASPEVLNADDQISPAFEEALAGHTVGSRVAVAAPPEDAFGEGGQPQLGLGNGDTVLFVVDIVDTVLDGPQGEEQPTPDGAPELVEADGVPTGFETAGVAAPDGLQVHTLVEGDGAEVERGQTVVVDYLGQVLAGKAREPFDQTYERGQPAQFPIGTGAVIQGWDRALVGSTVGSRLVLVVPSRLGYGQQGSGEQIEPGDDLVFVVDVRGAV